MRLKNLISFLMLMIMVISSCNISFAEENIGNNNAFIDDEVTSTR